MPFNQYPVEITASAYVDDVFIVENGSLVGVMLAPEVSGTGIAENYAQLYLASTDTPTPIPILQLASGYFGADYSIAWDGRIKLDPAMAILVRVWSHRTFRFRLSIVTEVE